jgi:hypothetical protein
VAGQILRKGVARKLRVLVKLMMKESILEGVFSDLLEDISDVLATTFQ